MKIHTWVEPGEAVTISRLDSNDEIEVTYTRNAIKGMRCKWGRATTTVEAITVSPELVLGDAIKAHDWLPDEEL